MRDFKSSQPLELDNTNRDDQVNDQSEELRVIGNTASGEEPPETVATIIAKVGRVNEALGLQANWLIPRKERMAQTLCSPDAIALVSDANQKYPICQKQISLAITRLTCRL